MNKFAFLLGRVREIQQEAKRAAADPDYTTPARARFADLASRLLAIEEWAVKQAAEGPDDSE